ncbi:PstS family phosphate ABC transporter substrate-binding protein [Capillimicrobium parvum]|uniref:PBP domain-containing protein n=1 Tax=Capillimicrobium parvum TaxID=2884022 RepID=A0A9E6Y261_9ACTN|nr:substrate-binding domain-containing protein [Capillimicrobium parvum]UGS38897.1 hypothetical protein DSM104329_05328 [Capillimicrobium parvum]
MNVRLAIAALLAGVAAAVLVACGIDTSDSGTSSVAGPEGTTNTNTVRRNAPPLPAAPENTVRVDGIEGGLSTAATSRFLGSSSVGVARITAGEEQAFVDLCAGRVDVIEVARLPTEAEVRACNNRGVELSEPLASAADAEVIATKNEADVGGDCITVQQARDIFRAGSPYTTWSQLGFFDLPLTTTGRQDGSGNFEFFGQVVLGVDDPSLADVRADYVVENTDLLEREEVVGQRRVTAAQRRVDAYEARLRRETARERRQAVDAAVRTADRAVLRAIARENQDLARRKVTLTAAQAARLEARNRVRNIRAKRRAAARVNARFDRELRDRVLRYARSQLALAEAPGVVGGFRFTYYELFEDQLRPMEIDYGVPVTASGQPVTLDDLSDKDRERILAAQGVTTPTVPNVGPAATVTTPDGNITTVQTATAIPDLPASQLPKKTKDGETIYPGPNCVFPSPITITSGAYPLSRRFYLFTSRQSLERDEVRAYAQAYLKSAQALATANRLVPITDAQLAEELAIIENRGRKPAAKPATTTTTRTVTTPSGTTTVRTVTTTTPATTTPRTQTSSGIPGVSSRGGG